MMLLDTPPGQQPTRINPAAIPRGRSKHATSAQANSGMILYCAQAPINISTGCEARMRKSAGRRVMPIVSMIKPNTSACTSPCTQVNMPGTTKANTATPITKGEVYCANQALALCISLNTPVYSSTLPSNFKRNMCAPPRAPVKALIVLDTMGNNWYAGAAVKDTVNVSYHVNRTSQFR